jgi:predicted transposase YbfD/YdcC
VLAVAAAAMLAGHRSVAAIAEWAADAPPHVLAALGTRGDPLSGAWQAPSAATIRRVLARIDADLLDHTLGAWLAGQLHPPGRHRRRAIAVDGKTLRGSADHDGHAVKLLAAMDHTDGAVVAQRKVDAATNEITLFQPLLDRLDLTDVVVTADALHTQRAHAEYLVGRRAHYLLVVKANQPTLHAQLAGLAWRDIPVMDRTRDHAHGRIELRTLKVAAVAGLGFPHAAQAIQVTRRAREPASRRWRTETVYAVTSLALGSASPAQLADYLRGHWSIENQLHWVRDMTFAEDASRARTGNLPHTMASLRNLAISVLRLTGHANIAAALRHSGRDPTRPLALLSIPIPHP